MSRACLFGATVAAALSTVNTPLASQTPRRAATPRPATAPFSVVEASIADLKTALEQGRTTSRAMVQQYLIRIATYEDRLNAIVAVNPEALAIADSLDRLRARGVILGPLHGIPVALKDNIHTVEMPPTAGRPPFPTLWSPTMPPRPGTSRKRALSSWPRPSSPSWPT